MKLRTQLLLSFLFLSIAAHAQWRVGLSGGVDYNSYTSDAHYLTDLHTEGRYGYTLGIAAQRDIKEWQFLHSRIGIRGEFKLTSKGYSLEKRGAKYSIFTYKRAYYQVPLMFTYSFGCDKLRAFINIGGYGALGDVKNWETNVRGSDLGGVFGAGAEWNFHIKMKKWHPMFTLQAEARCYAGALSVTTSDSKFKTPHYNTTTAFQLALFYNL